MTIPVSKVPPRNATRKGGKGGVWQERLEPVRRKPGQWFRLEGDWSQAVAGQIRGGYMKGVERHEFKAKQRKLPNGRYHVYVCYVGAPDPAELPDHLAGWTLKRTAGLPRRWTDSGYPEVQLPADMEWPERWVDPTILPLE